MHSIYIFSLMVLSIDLPKTSTQLHDQVHSHKHQLSGHGCWHLSIREMFLQIPYFPHYSIFPIAAQAFIKRKEEQKIFHLA